MVWSSTTSMDLEALDRVLPVQSIFSLPKVVQALVSADMVDPMSQANRVDHPAFRGGLVSPTQDHVAFFVELDPALGVVRVVEGFDVLVAVGSDFVGIGGWTRDRVIGVDVFFGR